MLEVKALHSLYDAQDNSGVEELKIQQAFFHLSNTITRDFGRIAGRENRNFEEFVTSESSKKRGRGW